MLRAPAGLPADKAYEQLIESRTAYPRQVRFCNGPLVVNPFCALPLPGSCFCTGSAQGCRLMALEKERAGPILMRGVAWRYPGASLRTGGLTRSIVPAGTSFGKAGVYLSRKPSIASPFAPHPVANSFSVRLNGVSPSRPTFPKAPGAAAVNTSRRLPPEAARSGVDGREHGATVDKAGPLMPPPPWPRRRRSHPPACDAGSPPAFWQARPLPSACRNAWRASPPSSSRRRL